MTYFCCKLTLFGFLAAKNNCGHREEQQHTYHHSNYKQQWTDIRMWWCGILGTVFQGLKYSYNKRINSLSTTCIYIMEKIVACEKTINVRSLWCIRFVSYCECSITHRMWNAYTWNQSLPLLSENQCLRYPRFQFPFPSELFYSLHYRLGPVTHQMVMYAEAANLGLLK